MSASPSTSKSWFLCVALALVHVLYMTPRTAGQDAVETEAATVAQPPRHYTAMEWKGMGALAFGDGFYRTASDYYRRYWDEAYNQKLVVDAAGHLVESLVPQEKFAAAAEILKAVPGRLAKLPIKGDRKLRSESSAVMSYWHGRLLQVDDKMDDAASLFLFAAKQTDDNLFEARSFLRHAECMLAAKRWNTMESSLKKVRKLAPGSADAETAELISIRSLVSRKPGKAARRIGDAWADAKGAFQVQIGMLQVQLDMARDEDAAALAWYRKHLEGRSELFEDAAHYPLLRHLARRVMAAADAAAAESLYEGMLPLLKSDAMIKEILLELHEAALQGGGQDRAVAALEHYLKLYSTDAAASGVRLRLAELHVAWGQLDRAGGQFRIVIDNPKAAADLQYRASHGLAALRIKAKEYVAAVAIYLSSARLDVSADAKARSRLLAAQAQYQANDFAAAAELFAAVAEAYPDTAFARQASFLHARAVMDGKEYRAAAALFSKFMETYPDSEVIPDAMLLRGRCEAAAGDFPMAIRTFRAFGETYPGHARAPDVFLQAADAAIRANLPREAVDILDHVIINYPDSKQYPHALYYRANYHLSHGSSKKFVADSDVFLQRFEKSHPQLASDIYMWLADHRANSEKPERAEHLYRKVWESYPDTGNAPIALYEAAKSAYAQKDFDAAVTHLKLLTTKYRKIPDRLRARVMMLYGDIASINGKFEEAAGWFKKSSELVPATIEHFAAIGRLGEMHYSLAREEVTDPHWQKALSFWEAIISAENAPNFMQEKAHYNTAKIYEKLGKTKLAQDEFRYIFDRYAVIQTRRVFDSYYYTRAGHDLAQLYLKQEERKNAIVILDRLAESDIPNAGEFGKEADRIRQELIKSNRKSSGEK